MGIVVDKKLLFKTRDINYWVFLVLSLMRTSKYQISTETSDPLAEYTVIVPRKCMYGAIQEIISSYGHTCTPIGIGSVSGICGLAQINQMRLPY